MISTKRTSLARRLRQFDEQIVVLAQRFKETNVIGEIELVTDPTVSLADRVQDGHSSVHAGPQVRHGRQPSLTATSSSVRQLRYEGRADQSGVKYMSNGPVIATVASTSAAR